MCQLCNESLQAAARSAEMLTRAAKNLHDMNDHVNSKVLAKAAADLFTEVKSGELTDEFPFGAGETAGPVKGDPEASVDGVKLPRGFDIDDEGIVRVNGVALGRVVVIGKPTKH